jgi:hypothetical protein
VSQQLTTSNSQPGAGAPADASERARLAIPYLGPVPPPSRPFGTALKYACAVAGVVRLTLAINIARRALLAQRLVHSGPTAELHRKWDANTDLLQTLYHLALVTLVLGIALDLAWRHRRRPSAVRRAQGEAYVESPLRWIVSPGLRMLLVLPAVAAFTLRTTGFIDDETPVHELPRRLAFLAAASACWAISWFAASAWVFVSDRALERRIGATGAARALPASVPYFPPVVDTDTTVVVTAGGIGWVFRTAGLVIVGVAALGATIGGVGLVLDGAMSGAVWFAVGLVGDVLVVRTFARRARRRRPAADGQFS